jgi:hypothetical protein
MDQFGPRRRRNGVGGGGFAGLRQFLAQRAFGTVQRSRQPIGEVIRQVFARQDKAP